MKATGLTMLVFFLCFSIARAEVRYTIETLDSRNSLAPRYILTDGNGINNNSVVVGKSRVSSVNRAYMWTNGITQNLNDSNPLPYYYFTSAYGINDTNQAVGIASVNNLNRAFFWDNGAVTDINTVNSLSGYVLTEALGINNQQQIVGRASVQNLDRAYLWQNGTTVDLNTYNTQYPYLILTRAFDINNTGDIVGYAWVSGHPGWNHSFLLRNGQVTDLYSSSLPNVFLTEAYGINDLGQVVGWARTGSVDRAYLWKNGNTTILQDEIPSNTGWILTKATGINNNGQIVGTGLLNGYTRAFLLTPVPEPSSLVSLGALLTPLLAFRRRR